MSTCPHPDKIRFATEPEADGKARRLRSEDPKGCYAMMAYLCRCGWWHIGRAHPEQAKALGLTRAGARQERKRRDGIRRKARREGGNKADW